MRQSSLNAIAIGVFSLTMLTLLGPAFHLPAAVPAVVTFGLLAVAAVDTFQWQGQGITILADWLAGNAGETQQRIIHHEAGHFLVAHLLEIPVSGYAINAWEAFQQGQKAQGGVRFEDGELAKQWQQGQLSAQLLDRYCTVWMAGIAAETLVYGTAAGGREDRTKVRTILTQIGRPNSEFKLKENWALLQAKTLIEKHRPAYKALVIAMTERSPLSECYHILEQNLSNLPL